MIGLGLQDAQTQKLIKMNKYLIIGTCVLLVRNTTAEQIDKSLDIQDEFNQDIDQYLT